VFQQHWLTKPNNCKIIVLLRGLDKTFKIGRV